jgi:ubiquinone/menaquinone biosynthesis C-methylase UbiE
MLPNKVFFDEASKFYDQMVNFDEGVNRRKELLKRFIEKDYFEAADIGCGSGMDSIALALNGLNVTSFDISEGMIEQAKRNSNKFKQKINFVTASAADINNFYHDKFSIVVSLGNTFANLNKTSLKKSIENIFNILKSKGKVLIQILNFKRIMLDKERIVNITEKDNYVYLRFYDFMPHSLNFNILHFNKNNFNERILITTSLYPHYKEDFLTLFNDAGFSEINFYSSLNSEEFIPDSSKDLIIEAIK